MEITSEDVGRLLAKRRNELGLSQGFVAEKAKIPDRTYQNYEAGQAIPADRFVRIAKVLDMSMDEIVHGKRAKPKITAADMTPDEFAEAVAAKGPDACEMARLRELEDTVKSIPPAVLEMAAKYDWKRPGALERAQMLFTGKARTQTSRKKHA